MAHAGDQETTPATWHGHWHCALAALQFPLFVNTGAGAGRGHVDFTPASVEYCLTLDISIPTSESYLHIYFPLK